MTTRLLFSLSILVAASVLACDVDGSVGRDEPKGGGSGGSSTGGATEGDSGSTSDDGSGTTVAEGEGTGGSGRDTVDTMPPQTTMDTTPIDEPVCEPVPDDMPCQVCRKENCCQALHACLSNDQCPCWWDCAVHDGDAQECDQLCGDGGGLYHELLLCVEGHCPDCIG